MNLTEILNGLPPIEPGLTIFIPQNKVRALLEGDTGDRLGQMILDLLVPKYLPDAVSMFVDYVRETARVDYAAEKDSCLQILNNKLENCKIAMIRVARLFSNNNREFRESLKRDYLANASGGWGLAEAKTWVESNLEKIRDALNNN